MSENSAVEYFITTNARNDADIISQLGSTLTIDKVPLANQVIYPAVMYNILDDFTKDIEVVEGVVILTEYMVEILAVDESNSNALRNIEYRIGYDFHRMFNVTSVTPYGNIDSCTRGKPVNRMLVDRDNKEWYIKGYLFMIRVRV